MNDGDPLPQIQQQLGLRFAEASLRGQGKARFVFARQGRRAVEISADGEGWWLEFWEGDPELDAAPVKEATLPTCAEAVKEAGDWLSAGAILANARRDMPVNPAPGPVNR